MRAVPTGAGTPRTTKGVVIGREASTRAHESAHEPDGSRTGASRVTFGQVFAVSEFRALWVAQVLSIGGDQLARVALTLLVYDRTRSALLAAVTFAASVIPTFVGGIALAGLADRFPRREVMIGCDLLSAVLVGVMAVPGMPLAILVVLLFLVTMVGAPFSSARAALYPDILHGDRYVLGTAITITTIQFAQVVGFAAGGVAVGVVGVPSALLLDAVTFALSGLITWLWVRHRPAPGGPAHGAAEADATPALEPAGSLAASPDGAATAGVDMDPGLPDAARVGGGTQERRTRDGVLTGLRVVFTNPALRTPVLLGWLATFYNVPEGVAAPLAVALGGGAAAMGLILAAPALGASAGAIAFSRFVAPARRLRWMQPLAVVACGVLAAFAFAPGLPFALVILVISGLLACYQLAANASFVSAVPPRYRSRAFGVAQAGMSLGQGAAIVLAGAATQAVHSASGVIAVAGAAGAICGIVIAISNGRARRSVPGAEDAGDAPALG